VAADKKKSRREFLTTLKNTGLIVTVSGGVGWFFVSDVCAATREARTWTELAMAFLPWSKSTILNAPAVSPSSGKREKLCQILMKVNCSI